MISKSISITILVLILAVNFFGQKSFIEDGWKEIKPLITDKTTLEKVVGLPKASKDGYYNYKTDEFFMQVNYSTAPCKESDYNRGKFNIPENTVLGYNVILSEGIKLSEFKFQREKYTKETDSEQRNVFYYINFEEAIHLGITVVNGVEYVGRIWFYPSDKDGKKYECKNPQPSAGQPQTSKPAEKVVCGKPR